MLSHPMLASTLDDPSQLQYPVLATPKVDGIRCLVVGGRALTRSFKPLPNAHIASLVSQLPEGVDGELVVPGGFSATQSAVMRRSGAPDFAYMAFDVASGRPYKDRVEDLRQLSAPWLQLLIPEELHSAEDFLEYEAMCIAAGYEGVMARDPDGPYLCGRSTPSQGYLAKWKRFRDGEAVVIGFKEQMRNDNPITRDELGRARRLGGRSNSTPKGTLGSLQVETADGLRFDVGGFDDAMRAEVWANWEKYMGRVVRYKYQELGSRGRPRFPRFAGWRADE